MRLLRDEDRRSTNVWAILAFGVVGAFLLFYRPPTRAARPFAGADTFLDVPHPNDSRRIGELFNAAEEADPPPADLARLERIFWLQTEINNGGLFQYFYNSTGDHAAETLADLKAIGATKTAAVLEEAMARFPQGKPNPDRVLRQRQLLRIGDLHGREFDDLDQRFYFRSEALADLLDRARTAPVEP